MMLASAATSVQVVLLEASLLPCPCKQSYHFTVVTYLHQPTPLHPVAVLNRSFYCIFEIFTDVDKLVLVHSNILSSSFY